MEPIRLSGRPDMKGQTDVAPPSLETKSYDSNNPDVKRAFGEFTRMFETFRAENDSRIAAIEKKRGDVLNEEKVDRLNELLTKQQRKIERLELAGRRPALDLSPAAAEHKEAFARYVRRGELDGLKAIERKALAVSPSDEGGYLVPEPVETQIDMVLKEISPIRNIATVRQIGGTSYRKPVSKDGAASGWVGEKDPRSETTAPKLDELEFPAMELYAMPAATQTLLDDSAVDIESWIADEVEMAFAVQEGAAFVSGDGVKKPVGFTATTKVANSSWTWGKIGTISTGVAGDWPATNPSEVLMDLVFALKAGYRTGGRFVMNRKTLAQIRKMKDDAGNYLWQPSLAAGQPSTLLGYPITEAEDMPDIAANAHAIAFGDFARGYLIVDRIGTRILRDPYSAKPYVLFYTTKRVGGGVQNWEAIKLLKFA